jgi:hypothetical protein
MRQFEQGWLELGRRMACSLHYQHPRNLRLVQAAGAGQTAQSLNGSRILTGPPPRC